MSNIADLNMLKYWRATLADSARVVIEVDKTLHQREAKIDLNAGIVDVEQTLALITAAEKRTNENKGRLTKDNPGWETLDEVPVLIAPFRVSLDVSEICSTSFRGKLTTQIAGKEFQLMPWLHRQSYHLSPLC